MHFVKTRWFLAAVCVLASAIAMAGALKNEGMGAAFPVIFSVLSFVSAIILVAPETAVRVAELCSRPITSLIFPNDRFSKPPLSYALARRHRTMQQLDEALEEYKSIIENYPMEREAYVELMEVAERLENRKVKAKYQALFKRRFGEAAS